MADTIRKSPHSNRTYVFHCPDKSYEIVCSLYRFVSNVSQFWREKDCEKGGVIIELQVKEGGGRDGQEEGREVRMGRGEKERRKEGRYRGLGLEV